MKRIRLWLLMGIGWWAVTASGATTLESFSANYVGASGLLMLPQGGARVSHLGGASLRYGRYLTTTWAFEGEVASLENRAGLAVRTIWHLQGWETFGRLFGYERLDPFLSAGVSGFLPAGDVGPSVGLGTFYYLSEVWAVRALGAYTLGLDGNPESYFQLSLGVQFSF